MDEEQSFAALLRSSTPAARPSWNAPSDPSADPWANPFASSPTQPFAAPSIPSVPSPPRLDSANLDLPDSNGVYGESGASGGFDDAPFDYSIPVVPRVDGEQRDSPYVQQLESEGVGNGNGNGTGNGVGFGAADYYTDTEGNRNNVDPPSIIAARELEALSAQHAFEPYHTPAAGVESENPFAQTNSRDDTAVSPSIPNSAISPPPPPPQPPKKPGLPADLIDDDLMAESDPMLSLKKAFVKSTAASNASSEQRGAKTETGGNKGKGAYVFTPSPRKAALVASKREAAKSEVEVKAKEKDKEKEVGNVESTKPALAPASVVADEVDRVEKDGKEVDTVQVLNGAEIPDASKSDAEEAASVEAVDGQAASIYTGRVKVVDSSNGETANTQSLESAGTSSLADRNTVSSIETDSTSHVETGPSNSDQHLAPTAIPLPDSTAPSPGISREATTAPKEMKKNENDEKPSPILNAQASESEASIMPPAEPDTPADESPAITSHTPRDRVAVSPLDAPSGEVDFDFKALSIGGSASVSPAVVQDGTGWGEPPLPATATDTATATGNSQPRFSGRGWGAVDDNLFGSASGGKNDPWASGSGGWGGDSGSGPSVHATPVQETAYHASTTLSPARESTNGTDSPAQTPQTPSNKPHRKTHPVFTVSISDPTRVGDPVRGYTVYTVRTRTTSPHYRKSDLSALRRFSDFLWLFDALVANNPGIIVPPVPDKHTFGRFQEQFIETRRLALEKSLNKITSHPVLQLDPDLRLFLESDHFAAESKSRQPDPLGNATPSGSGLLSSWTGSGSTRYVESDDWFTSRTTFLDSLEVQLKALSKSIDQSSKTRLELALSMGENADAMARLAESDLGSAMCAALARLADLGRREREGAEEMAKGDVVVLLNLADEYIRFIGSVRIAMGGRVRTWYTWQAHVKEVARYKAQREKMRAQGKLGDRAAQSLAEINELERRAKDAEIEFTTISKVVKSEFTRFERERVESFKAGLERWLDDQIVREKDIVAAWEEYHGVVLRMVQKAQGRVQGGGAGGGGGGVQA